jgi:zinc/manganese transport system substrate-binding protein
MFARIRFIIKKRYTITSQFLLLGCLVAGALAIGNRPVSAEPLPVVASFTILADLTRQVAGERARVTSLVSANADAHVYRPAPADVKVLRDARVIVVNGLGFEGFMPRLIKSSGTKAEIITATKGLLPLKAEAEHGHGGLDPHAWQSIDAVKLYVANIRDGLSVADPAGAAIYTANAKDYLAKLDTLKAEVVATFAAIPLERRNVISNHDAFRYFQREFGLKFEGITGVSNENDPTAKDVARIIRLAKAKKVSAVFLENMSNPKIAEQIAREAGIKIGGTLYSDALSETGGKVPTYIALMRHNVKTLADALKD